MSVFLILGDGDFSFSLDFIKCLSNRRNTKFHVIATGIDTLEEMKEKYKNCESILSEIKASSSEVVSVEVHHGINAVCSDSSLRFRASVVIFNHPHLGVEDAERHGRFLHHFFHECKNSWLNGAYLEGTVQLTLVCGQWDRWNGQQAAAKHGFSLRERFNFIPPPVLSPKYQYRRHHTGKSFKRRVVGSETFVLGRNIQSSIQMFHWQNIVEDIKVSSSDMQFRCSLCDRTFAERRSLNNHIKSLHENFRYDSFTPKLKCHYCGIDGTLRIFDHAQALADHIQAKHEGIHTEKIIPNWAQKKDLSTKFIGPIGRCSICDIAFQHQDDVARHLHEFIPCKSLKLSFLCNFCPKEFCDKRSLLQHENFCRKKRKC
jgi:hypothetical protein